MVQCSCNGSLEWNTTGSKQCPLKMSLFELELNCFVCKLDKVFRITSFLTLFAIFFFLIDMKKEKQVNFILWHFGTTIRTVYKDLEQMINLDCDLSDIPPCQNMSQGRFMVGAGHESRLMRSRCKNTWPCRQSTNGAPQAPSN